MLGQFKPVAYEPYGRRRSRWQLPPWVLLLLTGIVAGALGLAILQERYLPPRLSADASAKLRGAYEKADAERQALNRELADTQARLSATLTENKNQREEFASSHATIERARAELAAVIGALPPDPRGGTVEVRAGRLSVKGNQLAYDLVLTRERAGGKPLSAVLQLVVNGASARGVEANVTLSPVNVSLGAQEVLRGSVTLPDGFKARQTSIQLLDRPGGKLLGMRVLLVS